MFALLNATLCFVRLTATLFSGWGRTYYVNPQLQNNKWLHYSEYWCIMPLYVN